MKMRCIIVDDEPLVRELIEDHVRKIPFLEVVKTCRSGLQAQDVLQNEEIDLIFLDLQMPGLNGLQFLRSLPEPPLVVMITAYEQYAVEGFDLQVVDYILKPFSFERLLKACNRAAERWRVKRNMRVANTASNDFFVNVEYALVKVPTAEILYIEGLKDYVKIHLCSGPKPVITRMSMKAIEAKLPAGAFIRTHKSFLVAVSRISIVKRDFVFVGTTEIPVSATFRRNIDMVLKTHLP